MTYDNLDRIHESIRSNVTTFCDRLTAVLGSNLHAISAYGSATGPDFVPGKSDVNIVVIVAKIDAKVLTSLLDTVKWGKKKKRITAPLLLTPAYIESSLDVFPIEFMEIRESQALLSGDDHFGPLEVKPLETRLECESQLKSSALRTRQAYLEIGMTRKGAESVLHTSVTSLIPVLRAMLWIKGEPAPRRNLDVVKAAGRVFEIDTGCFESVLEDKAGAKKMGDRQADGILASYVDIVESLADSVKGL